MLQYTSTSFMYPPVQLFLITCTQLNNYLEIGLMETKEMEIGNGKGKDRRCKPNGSW